MNADTTVGTSHKAIGARFKDYRKEMNDSWRTLTLIEWYIPHIRTLVKSGQLPPPDVVPVAGNAPHSMSRDGALGTLAHISTTTLLRTILLETVACFEYFHADLCRYVFTDFPEKMARQDEKETPARQENLISLILRSPSKEEIVSQLIEERVRSIFYGNPIAFFEGDRGRLEFGNAFRSNCGPAMRTLSEIQARRNVYAHNDGYVDRKYLKEVLNPEFSLGRRAILTSGYLKESIDIMVGIGAMAGFLVRKNVYNDPPRPGILLQCFTRFKRLHWVH